MNRLINNKFYLKEKIRIECAEYYETGGIPSGWSPDHEWVELEDFIDIDTVNSSGFIFEKKGRKFIYWCDVDIFMTLHCKTKSELRDEQSTIMDYKQILDDILQLDERVTIIRGFGDVIGVGSLEMMFKEFNKDSYWIVMGRGPDEMIVETMSESVFDVDREGEYEFKALLKWIPGEYDECGRCTMRDYLEVEHIEFHFIQTFQGRERQEKLDLVLSKEMEDLFKF